MRIGCWAAVSSMDWPAACLSTEFNGCFLILNFDPWQFRL